MKHAADCPWPRGDPCREFSTDGTWLGAHIAHSMGTTSEKDIAKLNPPNGILTGMPEEQADWDAVR